MYRFGMNLLFPSLDMALILFSTFCFFLTYYFLSTTAFSFRSPLTCLVLPQEINMFKRTHKMYCLEQFFAKLLVLFALGLGHIPRQLNLNKLLAYLYIYVCVCKTIEVKKRFSRRALADTGLDVSPIQLMEESRSQFWIMERIPFHHRNALEVEGNNTPTNDCGSLLRSDRLSRPPD